MNSRPKHTPTESENKQQIQQRIEYRTQRSSYQRDANLLQSAENTVGRIHQQHAGNTEHHCANIVNRVMQHTPLGSHGHAQRACNNEQRHRHHHANDSSQPQAINACFQAFSPLAGAQKTSHLRCGAIRKEHT